jgi:repressor LexA
MENRATERQKQLLSIVYDFLVDTGYPPTFAEMKEALGVASNQSVIDLLEKLKRNGLIKRESGARSIAILHSGYEALGRPPLAPVLGMTTAGAPAEAIEISGEWQTLSKDVSRLASNVFVLRVCGDSMINAGIDDNDLVLVQEKKEFVSGEIVLADVEGEYTIKRFMSEEKPPYVYLKPENPNYPIILFKDNTELKGKVISCLKNNQWQAVK